MPLTPTQRQSLQPAVKKLATWLESVRDRMEAQGEKGELVDLAFDAIRHVQYFHDALGREEIAPAAKVEMPWVGKPKKNPRARKPEGPVKPLPSVGHSTR